MMDPFALSRLIPVVAPPDPKADWALFLDLDGTLLDIAATPDRVAVPRSLIYDLDAASVALRGALAIVSGRSLNEIDALLNPLRFAGSGGHGAMVRLPGGQVSEIEDRIPADWIATIQALVADKQGILLERKPHSIALHYRQAPRLEDYSRQLCAELISGFENSFEVLQGRMVVEVRPRKANKGRVVDMLMQLDPFRGRKPVFVGDDITDEDGFRAALRHGGTGLDVFVRFAGRPHEVRRWLKQFAVL